MNVAVRQNLITSDEFDHMVGKGIAAVLGPVELREGTIHRMNAQHVPHGRAKMALFRALDAALRNAEPALEVATEITVSFGKGFAPLPDVLVWRPVKTRGPIPGESVALIVEIADTTLADDLGAKQAAYAGAGLPEYWVVDLGARILHQFSHPKDNAYTRASTHADGASVESSTIPGAKIALQIPL